MRASMNRQNKPPPKKVTKKKVVPVTVSIPTPRRTTVSPAVIQEVVQECTFQLRAQMVTDRYESYLSGQRVRLPSFAAPWDKPMPAPPTTLPLLGPTPTLQGTRGVPRDLVLPTPTTPSRPPPALMDCSVLTEDLERGVADLKADIERENQKAVPECDSPTTRRLLAQFSTPSKKNHSTDDDSNRSIVFDPVIFEEDSWDALLRSVGHAFAPFLASSASFPTRRTEFAEIYSRDVMRLRTDVPCGLLYDFLCATVEDYGRLVSGPLATLSQYRDRRADFITDHLKMAFPSNPGAVSMVAPDAGEGRRRIINPHCLHETAMLDAILVCVLVESVVEELERL